jgi:prepilin-type processing-associated H-X9-DG protein
MRRLLPALLVTALAAPTRAAPARPEGPAELAYVPPDAVLVVHARLADLWKSDGLKDVRRIILKAGPEALATLDRRFTPAPSTADRVLAYVVAPAGDRPPEVVAFLTFTKPFDKAAALRNSFPTAQPVRGKAAEWYGNEAEDYGILFPGDRTLVFGTYRGVAALADRPPAKNAAVAASVPELADPKKLVVVAANPSALPARLIADVTRAVPPALQPLLRAKAAVVSLDGGADGQLHVRLTYPDKEAADAADQAIRAGVAMGKETIGQARADMKKMLEGDGRPAGVDDLPNALLGVVGLGALQEVEDILTDLPLQRSGESFHLAVRIPAELRPVVLGSGMAAGLLVPATQRIRAAANRMKSSNNLKQFALAIHNYHDVNNSVPVAICDNTGKPLLSWRVAILPYVEQDNLYKQFKLDEPWDSENNKKLIEKMPKIFELPGAPAKPGQTHYRTFVGQQASWKTYADQVKIPASIPDGMSQTWMIVEAEEAVTWTKPDELAYDGKTVPKLGKFSNGGFNVAYWDGSVHWFAKAPKGVHKYITPAGGEVISPDDEK